MKVKFKKSVRFQGGAAKPGEIREISDKDARFLIAIKAAEQTNETAAAAKPAPEPVVENDEPAPKRKPGRPPKNRQAESEETRGE